MLASTWFALAKYQPEWRALASSLPTGPSISLTHTTPSSDAQDEDRWRALNISWAMGEEDGGRNGFGGLAPPPPIQIQRYTSHKLRSRARKM